MRFRIGDIALTHEADDAKNDASGVTAQIPVDSGLPTNFFPTAKKPSMMPAIAAGAGVLVLFLLLSKKGR